MAIVRKPSTRLIATIFRTTVEMGRRGRPITGHHSRAHPLEWRKPYVQIEQHHHQPYCEHQMHRQVGILEPAADENHREAGRKQHGDRQRGPRHEAPEY